MKKTCLALALGCTVAFQFAQAQEPIPLDLTAKAPACRKTPKKRRVLAAERGPLSKESIRVGWYSPLVADFNGDGWCDFAWAIPYPVNSKMESYWLEDVLILGGAKKWRAPFHGKRPWALDIEEDIEPIFRVDLVGVSFIYRHSGGAPYVLGIGPDSHEPITLGCSEYASVHRWDDTVDAFRKADEATRKAVIDFYYSSIGQRCARSKR
jgi:hypothetical protein